MVCLRNMCMATLNKGDNDVIIIIIITYFSIRESKEFFIRINIIKNRGKAS